MAATRRFWSMNQCLTLCVLSILFVCGHCNLNLACIEVKKAYTQNGGNENEVPIQAIPGDHLRVCAKGSTCCTENMETKLKSLSTKEYNNIVDDAFKYAKSTFVTRTRKFNEFFTELLENSRKDLDEMFVQTYGLLYKQNSYVFVSLFEDLRNYYTGNDMNLLDALNKFFKALFRKMFELLNESHSFTDSYLDCVTSQMDKLKPFGDVPQKLSTQVKRSFVAARTFVQGLAIGRDVILEVLKIPPTEACTNALMRMKYCPHCQGLTQTKPCNNYCLNTMKGCLAYHAELNGLWNKYIEAMKNLASRLEGPFNIESVVDPIDVKISDAIMNLQENGIQVKKKVFEGCGRPGPHNVRHQRDTAAVGGSKAGEPLQGVPPMQPQKDAAAAKPDQSATAIIDEAKKKLQGGAGTQFPGGQSNPNSFGGASYDQYDHFSLGSYNRPKGKKQKHVRPTTAAGTSLDRLVKDIKGKVEDAKDFWVNLPYTICSEDDIAAQPVNEDDCWNGHDRARYTAPVKDSGVIHQINNPEVHVDINEANYIIEQQKIQLKIITSKLNNAFNGEDVTWVETEIGPGQGSGSGSDLYGSGDYGSGMGSGSGDGSDGDDEDMKPGRNPNRGHTHKGHGKKQDKDRDFFDRDGDKGEIGFGPGPEYTVTRNPSNTRKQPQNAAVCVSVSWTSLSLLFLTAKMIYHIMI